MEIQLGLLIATALGSLGTIILAGIGIKQISTIKNQLKINSRRKKKWETINACRMISEKNIYYQATKDLWDLSKKGKDYTKVEEATHSMVILLNYYEDLAIGIAQDIYNEEIVYDYHKDLIYKIVKAFIFGESGSVNDDKWTINESLVSKKHYPFLVSLYEKWFNTELKTMYQDTTP